MNCRFGSSPSRPKLFRGSAFQASISISQSISRLAAMRKANTGVQSETKSGLTKLMTPPEVAELLQVELTLMNSWRTSRKGPAFIKVGSLVRYRVSDVEAWIESQRVEAEFKSV